MELRRIIFLSLIFLLTFYVCLWIRTLTKSKKSVWFLTPLLFLGVTGWQFAYRYSLPSDEITRTVFYWSSSILLSFFVVFLLLALPFDIARIIGHLGAWTFRKKDFLSSRREFLKKWSAISLFGSSGAIGTVGTFDAMQAPKVKEVVIPLENLPEAFHNFKIAQISDLHVGPTIRKAYVKNVVEATNAVSPDLVALTGDMIDGYVNELNDEVEPLASLTANEGIYFVTGNHEYYWGAENWISKFSSMGITPLINENRILTRGDASLCIAGVPDTAGDRHLKSHFSNPHAALQGIAPEVTKVLLAHRPQSCFEAAKAGFHLQICGHTHAGQFFPWSLFVPLAHPYYKGLNVHEKMYVYVNSGTGYWGPPNRFAVPTEITLFRLVRES